MTERCKNCKEKVESGIWESPRFVNEKVRLFCSNKCREEYTKAKLRKIKIKYPNYYKQLIQKKIEKNTNLNK